MAITRGHQLLRRWMDRTGSTQAHVAKLAKRSEPAVSLWFSGSRPDGDARIALKKIVPPEAWSEPLRSKEQ